MSESSPKRAASDGVLLTAGEPGSCGGVGCDAGGGVLRTARAGGRRRRLRRLGLARHLPPQPPVPSPRPLLCAVRGADG
eukprot:3146004-Rhodomonas_salina.3